MQNQTEFTEALGQSDAFLDFQEKLSRVAPVNRPVLVIGERGTGKELAVKRLHYLSHRWQEQFVTLNCAALTPSLVESELFGYQKGAFTGAVASRKGRFELAENGTLFLDEIGSVPLQVQEKILRVVEYGSFERVGASHSIEVDVRIIGATNADLVAMAEQGEFKRDLLDRISFEVLYLPPLRQRHGDILLLVNYFASKMAYELQRPDMPVFSADAIRKMEHYSWPGNIRELKNVVERAVYRTDSPLITEIDFTPFPDVMQASVSQEKASRPLPEKSEAVSLPLRPLKQAVRNLEISLLRKALQKGQYNQRKAAQLLELSYDQFRNLKRKHADALQQ
jgi:psp operon transcriptional activator